MALSSDVLVEKIQIWSWRRSSIVLCFQDTETNLTGTRTQNTFGVLTHLKSLPGSRHKHAKFGANWFIHSRDFSERNIHTKPQNIPMAIALHGILYRR
jgi:hypothetical protein